MGFPVAAWPLYKLIDWTTAICSGLIGLDIPTATSLQESNSVIVTASTWFLEKL